MSVRQLSAQTALVKTAAIEIKTLTISGKQLTLSAFRQIPESPLIDEETLKLNGIAWGHVNYHPDKCAESGTHLHVIWQKEQSLYRSAVYKAGWSDWPHWEQLQCVAARYTESRIVKEFKEQERRIEEGEQRLMELNAAGLRISRFLFDDCEEDERGQAMAILGEYVEEAKNINRWGSDALVKMIEQKVCQWLPDRKYLKVSDFCDIPIYYWCFRSAFAGLGKSAKDLAAQKPEIAEEFANIQEDLFQMVEDCKAWRIQRGAVFNNLCQLDQLYIAL